MRESLDNMTPADVLFSRHKEIQTAREMVKTMTLNRRRYTNMGLHPPDQQAIWARDIAIIAGRTIATPDEAQTVLGLKQ